MLRDRQIADAYRDLKSAPVKPRGDFDGYEQEPENPVHVLAWMLRARGVRIDEGNFKKVATLVDRRI